MLLSCQCLSLAKVLSWQTCDSLPLHNKLVSRSKFVAVMCMLDSYLFCFIGCLLHAGGQDAIGFALCHLAAAVGPGVSCREQHVEGDFGTIVPSQAAISLLKSTPGSILHTCLRK